MATSEVCTDAWQRNEQPKVWQEGIDTVYNHPLFSNQHNLDSIKSVLRKEYFFANAIGSVKFVGYDNDKNAAPKRLKSKKKAKKKVTKKKIAKKVTKKKATKKKAKKKATKKKATKKKVAKKKAKKKATKKKATKKKAAKKKTTKKKAAKKKTKRKPNAAFMRPLTPSAALAAVIGRSPIPRNQVVKKLWQYIKKHDLQDAKNRRNINADSKLKPVFGKNQVSMFEMTKIVSKHLK